MIFDRSWYNRRRAGDGVLHPIKANDADSEVARRGAIEWFNGTARSRLDDR
jgi:hypothetical protein